MSDKHSPTSQVAALISRGKEQGYLTYAEVNDHLPDSITETEDVSQDFNNLFENLLKNCRHFSYIEYENRSIFNKLIDGFARLLSSIL